MLENIRPVYPYLHKDIRPVYPYLHKDMALNA